MTMRVRAGLMLIVAVAIGLTGCGHYIVRGDVWHVDMHTNGIGALRRWWWG